DHGLEGMIAKDGASPYLPGRRSDRWLKVKTHLRQEAVIGGFTKGRGGRKGFGALVLGVHEGKNLIYVGHTGSGFNSDSLEVLREESRSLPDPDQDDRKGLPRKATPNVSHNNRSASGDNVEIDGHALHLTNLQKVYWPDDGYAKGDLINYYRDLASTILPYLR